MPEQPTMPPGPPAAPEKLPEITPAVEQINLLSARLRISEERYSEIRKKLLLMEQNMLNNHKRAMDEIKSLQGDFGETKRTIQEVEDRIITIIKELRLTARKEDIDVMKRYIELWNPTTFVRQEQVERIVEEKLGKKPMLEEHAPPNYDSPS